MTDKKCIGYGEFEGKCNNIAGTKWSPHWCERCNKLRLDHIDKQLATMRGYFSKES
jgi:hypothetical protein